eukprot:350363-Chlamydomonas_euryale.AAC.1
MLQVAVQRAGAIAVPRLWAGQGKGTLLDDRGTKISLQNLSRRGGRVGGRERGAGLASGYAAFTQASCVARADAMRVG